MLNKRLTRIEILCHRCKTTTDKPLSYLIRRVKEGKLEFFCSRKCTDSSHSNRMMGDKNPNFEGKWYGPDPSSFFTTEERSTRTKAQIQGYKDNGTFDDFMKNIHAGHKRFFATDEGKRIRSQNGVKSALLQSKGMRTSIEVKMADELTRRGIKYEEQRSLSDKFLLDFFLPEFNIIIECDGDYWHRLPKNMARDKSKNAYIKACGISLYRFWESEINTDVEACVDVVLAEINEKSAI